MTSIDRFLEEAIQEARQGLLEGGIPIGSVIVHGDAIIGRGRNRRVQKLSAILHGEMDALENAGRQPPRSTGSALSSRRSHPAPCARGPLSCTEFPALSSARTGPSWARRSFSARVGSRLRFFRMRNVSGLWRSSYGIIPLSGTKTPVACTCVMCRLLTSCNTFSRSRSFVDIHSSSFRSAMPHESGTFYFAQRGTSHVAATGRKSAVEPQ